MIETRKFDATLAHFEARLDELLDRLAAPWWRSDHYQWGVRDPVAQNVESQESCSIDLMAVATYGLRPEVKCPCWASAALILR